MPVGTTTVRQLLQRRRAEATTTRSTPPVFAPDGLLGASPALLDNLAGANLVVTIDGSLSVGIAKDAGGVVGVTLGPRSARAAHRAAT